MHKVDQVEAERHISALIEKLSILQVDIHLDQWVEQYEQVKDEFEDLQRVLGSYYTNHNAEVG